MNNDVERVMKRRRKKMDNLPDDPEEIRPKRSRLEKGEIQMDQVY
jgi:hypothetical protein